jgi:hypothetical protein
MKIQYRSGWIKGANWSTIKITGDTAKIINDLRQVNFVKLEDGTEYSPYYGDKRSLKKRSETHRKNTLLRNDLEAKKGEAV